MPIQSPLSFGTLPSPSVLPLSHTPFVSLSRRSLSQSDELQLDRSLNRSISLSIARSPSLRSITTLDLKISQEIEQFQVNPIKYNSIFLGLNILVKEAGPSALWRGWAGKFFGYGAQGGCKFGLYEYFKNFYSDLLVGQDRSLVFFVSSASAQVIADVALCPFEAIKVRVQTEPKFGKGLVDGFSKLYATEGLSGLYRGLFPLWGWNLPCFIWNSICCRMASAKPPTCFSCDKSKIPSLDLLPTSGQRMLYSLTRHHLNLGKLKFWSNCRTQRISPRKNSQINCSQWGSVASIIKLGRTWKDLESNFISCRSFPMRGLVGGAENMRKFVQ